MVLRVKGRGTAAEYKLKTIDFFVGAVEGLKLNLWVKKRADMTPLPSSVPKIIYLFVHLAPMPPPPHRRAITNNYNLNFFYSRLRGGGFRLGAYSL